MAWQEEYKRKLVSPEEAVKAVKSGDRVVIPVGRDPLALGLALAARKDELRGITIFVQTPSRDFGWYDSGWEESFQVQTATILPVVKEMMAERRCDLTVGFLDFASDPATSAEMIDVVMVEVSPPDRHGYCSFGASLWNKREQAKAARVVLAEVNRHLIRTFGENYIHVSDIDYFVEHTPTGRELTSTGLMGKTREPGTHVGRIAGYVSTLIRDGDTIQIGGGSASEPLPMAGALDGKHDLGWHSEATPMGIIRLVREGVITGARKSLDKGKAVATALGGGTPEDMEFVNENPLFELHSVVYVNDVKVISAQHNMVAINTALTVDLGGQIGAESVGTSIVSIAGGQPAFAIGAVLAPGGRSISCVPSTATTAKGLVSRIVPSLDKGTLVTVPRTAADYVVTEYGIAKLRGKTQRQRAEELIAIAHPDFRPELRREAKKLLWP